MAFNTNVNYKTNLQADIKRKQGLFNRFKRRYHTTNNPTERRFLKNEAVRIVTELRQWSKKWQNWGFGTYGWITRNYTVTDFNCYKPTGGRRTTASRGYGYKTCNRNTTGSYWGSTTTGRNNNRRNVRTRTYAARKNYVAW